MEFKNSIPGPFCSHKYQKLKSSCHSFSRRFVGFHPLTLLNVKSDINDSSSFIEGLTMSTKVPINYPVSNNKNNHQLEVDTT